MEDNLITIIGSGNLASHLVSEFKKLNADIHVNGRNSNRVIFLAEKFNIPFSTGFENIPTNSDIYIICTPDEAVIDISKNKLLKAKINNKLVVHTSGSISIDVLSDLSCNYGVLYPVQTFTAEATVDFKKIPVCIEANTGFNQDKIIKYVSKISDDLRRISSEQRQYIHLAAVFANNFTNRMFAIAEEILNEQHIDFNILFSLIEESARKIKLNSPGKIQTGPAPRNDLKTIEKHLELVLKYPELKEIYSIISKNISNSK